MRALPSARVLRALDVVRIVPAGHNALVITDERWSPHLNPGELAVIDPTDTAPQTGELYGLVFPTRNGTRTSIVQPYRKKGDTGIMFRFTGRWGRSAGFSIGDGPITLAGWTTRCVGRVVAVVEQSSAFRP